METTHTPLPDRLRELGKRIVVLADDPRVTKAGPISTRLANHLIDGTNDMLDGTIGAIEIEEEALRRQAKGQKVRQPRVEKKDGGEKLDFDALLKGL